MADFPWCPRAIARVRPREPGYSMVPASVSCDVCLCDDVILCLWLPVRPVLFISNGNLTFLIDHANLLGLSPCSVVPVDSSPIGIDVTAIFGLGKIVWGNFYLVSIFFFLFLVVVNLYIILQLIIIILQWLCGGSWGIHCSCSYTS